MPSPSGQNARILLVEDDIPYRESLRDALILQRYQVFETSSLVEATKIIEREQIDLVLLDLRLPESSGMNFLREQQERLQELMVIVLTAFPGSETAIEAMRIGAFDYLIKGGNRDELLLRIQRAIEHRRLVLQNRKSHPTPLETPEPEAGPLLGKSAPMLELFKTIGRVAATDAPVLVTGESGTGKELVARAIHDVSSRKDKPFIAFNSSSIPETLAESELFGHEQGAFTGATMARRGLIEQAEGGTLFCDEIADMPLTVQAKRV